MYTTNKISLSVTGSVFVKPDEGWNDDDYQVNDKRPDGHEHVEHRQLGVLVLQFVAQGQLSNDFHQADDEYDAPAAAAEHRHLSHGLARVAVHARAYYEQRRECVVQPDRHEYQIPALFLFGLQLYGEQHQEYHHRRPRGQRPLGQSHPETRLITVSKRKDFESWW